MRHEKQNENVILWHIRLRLRSKRQSVNEPGPASPQLRKRQAAPGRKEESEVDSPEESEGVMKTQSKQKRTLLKGG